jgi:MerR family transcriptional regulator, copper efflux regulator
MRIGEAAALAGVTSDTLRYYERQGILPRAARTASGYRDYPAGIVDRVRFARNALRFGFSIKQVAGFLKARESGRPPCREVRAAADRILSEMDRKIAEMTAARGDMLQTLALWDQRLAATPPGKPARLLESIASISER